MVKNPLLGNLACKLTTVIWHIQRWFRHRKENSKYCCDIKGYKHRKQWKCYYILFGQLYFRVLIWWRNNMSFSLCTHMNYKVLQVPSVQLRMDFSCKGQKRVMWLQLLLCLSAGIKPFQWKYYWVKQEERVYFCQVGGSATTFEKRTGGFGWAVQLAAMAHIEGKNLHRLPKQPAPKGVSLQGRRQPQWFLESWHVSPLMHISKTLHPDPKTHLVF